MSTINSPGKTSTGIPGILPNRKRRKKGPRGAGVLYDRLPRKRSMRFAAKRRQPSPTTGYGFLNARVSSVSKAKSAWHQLIARVGD